MKNLAALDSSQSPFVHSSPTFAMSDFSSGYRTGSQTDSFRHSTGNGFSLKKIFRPFKKSPLPFIILVIVVFVIAIVGISSVIRKSTTNVTQTNAQAPQQVSIAKPLATETLNKIFDFPLNDSTGKEVSKFQYDIQSVELDNQVIIKGEEATAIQGKVFLVINLKVTNNYDKAVQLNTRDYVRLIVNNDTTDKLAASIHNDPVDVEPISTTFTRIGFPINANTTNLALEVGEIDGAKQTIQLNLK